MAETMARKEFDRLDYAERRKFITSGGAVTDPAPPPVAKISDSTALTRKEFDALPPVHRLAEVRAGRRIVDGDRVSPPST